jgi:hypothetical protein
VSSLPDPVGRTVEDFHADLPAAAITEGKLRYLRAIAQVAYLYAMPAFLHFRQLTEYIQGRRYLAPDECPLGGWVLMRELADPTTATVSPNVDTLYGAAYVLLDEQGPVVLTTPPIVDRYWSVAVLDARFGSIAVVGSSTLGGAAGTALLAPPGWEGAIPDGIDTVVTATTSSLCLIQRIFVRGPDEYDQLHRLQDAITLTPLARWLDRETGFDPVNLTAYERTDVRLITDPLEFFELTNAYLAANADPGEAAIVDVFTAAGVGPGAALPENPDARSAIVAGARDAQVAIDARLSGAATRGGWRLPDPGSGYANPDLAQGAAIQLTQMGQLPLNEALYFFGYADADGRLLDGCAAYELVFPAGALPSHAPLGFWSITLYDERSLLVANEIDRYLIRPDTAGLTFGEDEALTIRLQGQRPDDTPQGNWLPTPDGPFTLALRVYLADPPVLDGTWTPPPINRREGPSTPGVQS